MTDISLDPFDTIRAELLRATTRDVSRSLQRARVARVVTATVGTLVLLTGIAAAASERVATAIEVASEGMLDVFHGPPSSEQPSAETREFMKHLQVGSGQSTDDASASKVLLHDRIDGIDVEVTVMQRPGLKPGSAWGDRDVCALFRWGSGATSRDAGASAFCGPQFIPYGVPGNVSFGRVHVGQPVVTYDQVTGILADEVVAVNAVTPSGTHPATLGDHVAWYRTTERVAEVQLITRDGYTWTIPRMVDFTACNDAAERTACERAKVPRTRTVTSQQ